MSSRPTENEPVRSARGTTGSDLRAVRLCSVFEPPASAVRGKGARFDPIGGMQNHAAALTRALDRRRVRQTVVTSRPPSAPWRARLGERARVIRVGLPVRRLRQLYSIPAAVLVPALAARADVVHVHLGEDLAALPVAVLAARLAGRPLVLTIHCSLCHTLRVTDLRSWVLARLGGPIEAAGERLADAVIALTPRLAGHLVDDGIDPDRIHVIPPGVDPALFERPLEDPFPRVPRPRIAFVGRMAPAKGVTTLVEALPLLRTAGAQLLLVGDGPERERVEALARRSGVDARVHALGFVEHHEVPAVLAHADLLVLPSVYEELGSVLTEAMQAGLPIVASRTGGIPDVITDDVNGLLVEPSAPRQLAQAIDRILASERLAARLGAAARETVRGGDWDAVAERVHGIYRDLTRL